MGDLIKLPVRPESKAAATSEPKHRHRCPVCDKEWDCRKNDLFCEMNDWVHCKACKEEIWKKLVEWDRKMGGQVSPEWIFSCFDNPE